MYVLQFSALFCKFLLGCYVTFESHVTPGAVSLPRFSAEEKGKGTTWKQDLIDVVESDIADTTIEDSQELEIAHLVSLWYNHVTTCHNVRFFFHFYLLFITCTFTVSHMTDKLPFLT